MAGAVIAFRSDDEMVEAAERVRSKAQAIAAMDLKVAHVYRTAMQLGLQMLEEKYDRIAEMTTEVPA